MYGIYCWHIYTNLHVGTFRKKSNIGLHLHKFQANLHQLVEFSHIHAFNGQNTFTKCPLLSQIPNFPYICHISEFTAFIQIYNFHTFCNYEYKRKSLPIADQIFLPPIFCRTIIVPGCHAVKQPKARIRLLSSALHLLDREFIAPQTKLIRWIPQYHHHSNRRGRRQTQMFQVYM